jgi:hypothetical protein
MTTATFAVLDKFFNGAQVPAACVSVRDQAYSRAHLRAAAQAWLARDFGQGEQHLRTAVELNSSLLDNGAGELARHFRSWTDLPKVSEPLEFLEGIYGHLPAELSGLAARKRSDLARAAVDFAHQFRAAGDLRRAGRCAWKAVGYRPTLLADRSLVSLLGRSILQKFKSEAATACD